VYHGSNAGFLSTRFRHETAGLNSGAQGRMIFARSKYNICVSQQMARRANDRDVIRNLTGVPVRTPDFFQHAFDMKQPV